MIKRLLMFLIAAIGVAHATTFMVNSGQSTATIQGVINGGSSGDTVAFAAGTYNITAGFTVKCGLTYTAVTPATPSNVILSASFAEESTDIFNVNAGCTSPTTFSYLSSLHAGFIFVNTPNTGLVITHNQFGDLKCCNSQIYAPAITFSDPAEGTSNILTNATITYNTIGDATSCTTPMNGMTLVTSPETYQGGCAGIEAGTSINGMDVEHNNFFHVGEGVHIICYPGLNGNQRCSPGDPGGSGPTTYNVTSQYNDFSNIHRIGWEEQAEAISAITFQYNTLHDWFVPYFGSFGISMACCANPASFAPFLKTSSNVVVFTVAPPAGERYGYGIEAWGTGPPNYNNNLLQSPQPAGNAMTYGYNASGIAPNWNYNTFCGLGFANAPYISQEFAGVAAPTTVGLVESASCSAVTSVAPTISPTPSGTYSAPITVTLSDAGYGSTQPFPNGNTSIYYTTDGSTPTTSSTLYTGSFTVAQGSTVNAIGMWGAPGQTTTYPAGYGFVPSAVQSAHYSAGSTPTLTGVSLTLTGGGNALQVGKSVQAIATCSYTGAITTSCGTTDVYGTTANTWVSSSPSIASISSAGSVAGLVAGTTNLTVHAGSFTSSPFALTVNSSAPVLQSVAVSCPSPVTVGQTSTCTALCNYTGPQQLNCTHGDANGTTAGGWLSSNTSVATVSSNVATAVAVGNANVTATAGGLTSSPATITVNAAPPASTLTAVSVTCPPGSVTVGSTTSCSAVCGYSDGSTANCNTTDSHGSLAGSWTSSVTANATINSTTGVVTGVLAGSTNISANAVNGGITVMAPAIALPVVAAPSSAILGNNQFNVTSGAGANYINATYAVTGSATGGYTVASCSFYLGQQTYPAGSKWDCGLIAAPTSTTQSSSWTCHATYTTLGTSADPGFHTLQITGCGTLAANTAWWIPLTTNQAGSLTQGFWNCGSSCTGSAPTVGNGTFPCAFVSASYGVYTGMQTAMSSPCGQASPQVQSTAYVTLNSPNPTLVSAFISPVGLANTLVVGGSFSFTATCIYSDGTQYPCYPQTTPYGDTVTQWNTNNAMVMTMGQIGSSHPSVATGISPGTANAQAFVGSVGSAAWTVTINAAPVGARPTSPKLFSR